MKRPLHRIVTAVALALVSGTLMAADLPEPRISDSVVRLGLLLDMSGPYADINGPGSVIAAQMAIEDFGGKVLGRSIELVAADHQNKPDIAATKAREWFDTGGVDAITDVAASATALAVVNIARAKNRIVMVAAAAGGTSRLTNEDCSDVSVHWTYNTWTLANVMARAIVAQGGDSWYFLTADYTFGQSLEKEASEIVRALGARVVGSVRHPLNTADFSSYLLQAQASGARIIALANAGADTVNAIKGAGEFGLTLSGKQSLAGLLMYISDVHALGLKATQGMLLTEAFYWDLDERTRSWARRFFLRHKRMPTSAQAGEYSAVLHYLRSVEAARTDDTAAVMAKMRELPVDDVFTRSGRIRADGAMVHPMYLARVKRPEQSKTPWDYLEIVATVPAEQAFAPLSASRCPFVKK